MTQTIDTGFRSVEVLTVAEVRAALASLPDDSILRWSEWDSEWDHVYYRSISSISEAGHVGVALIGGRAGYDESDDDE